MARTGVTFDDVAHAATKLLTMGEPPSVIKVREVLGTGSNSTIAEHLKRWKLERTNREGVNLPDSLPEELITPLEALWHIAIDRSDQRYLAEREAFTKKVEQLNVERETWITQHAQTDSLLQDTRARLKDTQELLVQSQEREREREEQCQSLSSQKHNLESHVERLERQLLEERQAHQAREQALNAQQAEARDQWQLAMTDLKATIEQNHQRAEATEARWLRMVDQARDEVKQVKKQQAKLLDEKDDALKQQHTQIQGLQEKLLDAHTNLAQKQALSDVQLKQISQLEVNIEQLNQQIAQALKEAQLAKTSAEHERKLRQKLEAELEEEREAEVEEDSA